MAQAEIDSSYSWVRLGISVLAGTMSCIGLWAAVLVLPNVQAEFDVSRGGASLAYTLAMVGFGLGNVYLGRLVDRHGIAPVLAGAAIVLSASFALSAFVNSMMLFALLQFPIGLATAAGFGPLIADISHWFMKRRGIAVAATAAGNYFAGALWPLALKDVIAENGWRPAFITVSIFCVVVLLPIAWMLRRRIGAVPSSGTKGAIPDQPVKSIDLSHRTLLILLAIAGVGCCVAMSMPQVHIVAYCADLGFGTGVGAEMLSTMLGAGIISRLLSGFLADRFGGIYTLLIGSVLQCLALFLYIPFNGLASLYIVSLVFGLSQGGIIPSYAIIIREYMPAAQAGQRVGFVIMATVMGMALGGWLSGLIYDLTGSYQAAFLNGIAWNVMNIAIMVFILMRSRPARPAADKLATA